MYTQPIDRNHPGCILFLVDQSWSMQQSFAGRRMSKAEALAQAVNRLIRNLVLQCQRGDDVRDYYEIGIIGYGDAVGPAFEGSLRGQQLVPISQLANLPLRMAPEALPDSPDVRIDLPIWIEPKSNGGTPMRAGIDLAGAFLVDWANRNFDSFPPIVVNVSDGEATDGDPRPIATQLRQIRTSDGNLLMFNINLSDQQVPSIRYPSSPHGLPNPYATGLFDMSSELTPYMLAVARNMDLPVGPGARGFVFNADADNLSEFLDVGTRISVVADR